MSGDLDAGFCALDWMLRFMPTLPEDRRQRAELAELNLESAYPASTVAEPDVAAEVTQGLAQGMAASWRAAPRCDHPRNCSAAGRSSPGTT